MALNWLCFLGAESSVFLCNSLYILHLSPFSLRANWLCFFNLSSIFRRCCPLFHLFFSLICHLPFDSTEDFNLTQHHRGADESVLFHTAYCVLRDWASFFLLHFTFFYLIYILYEKSRYKAGKFQKNLHETAFFTRTAYFDPAPQGCRLNCILYSVFCRISIQHQWCGLNWIVSSFCFMILMVSILQGRPSFTRLFAWFVCTFLASAHQAVFLRNASVILDFLFPLSALGAQFLPNSLYHPMTVLKS